MNTQVDNTLVVSAYEQKWIDGLNSGNVSVGRTKYFSQVVSFTLMVIHSGIFH
jgi:hypothetical protein